MAPVVIDRRSNPSKKNLSNRQRFIERFKGKIAESAKKSIGKRSITDSGDQEISIPADTDEPRFNHRNDSGDWDYVLPGNEEYMPGDPIKKPSGGTGGGRGKNGSPNGEDLTDEFEFYLNYEEYLNIIFDDLELPDLIKHSEKLILSHQLRRAGFTTSGVPTNLNVEKTALAGLSRRIALKTPKLKQIEELQAQLEQEQDADKRAEIQEEINRLKIHANAIGFLDSVDLRYNNFVPQPKPITQAVMFCVMDVSYSMGEKEKTIAKKFFMLLYLFLNRRYKNVEVVFIRHHDRAIECDEESFFKDRESGGTVVSTAYELVEKIIEERFPVDSWNMYLAQASDGDNSYNDINHAQGVMSQLIDNLQFMCYVEILAYVHPGLFDTTTNLYKSLGDLQTTFPKKILINQIFDESEVVQVFRKFFARTTQ